MADKLIELSYFTTNEIVAIWVSQITCVEETTTFTKIHLRNAPYTAINVNEPINEIIKLINNGN